MWAWDPLRTSLHVQDGAPVQDLLVPFAYLLLQGILSTTSLTALSSEEHYHNLVNVFGSSKLAALIAQTTSFLPAIRGDLYLLYLTLR